MRIWSLHPKYLDTKGLVALWRETLLAKNVLEGNTKGYKNHPQLLRFKNAEQPLQYINQYLQVVYNESLARGYNFNSGKFEKQASNIKVLNVSNGQLEYEWRHLLNKLKVRDIDRYNKFLKVNEIEVNPIFRVVEGGVEEWEII
jgi:hypothetical protein